MHSSNSWSSHSRLAFSVLSRGAVALGCSSSSTGTPACPTEVSHVSCNTVMRSSAVESAQAGLTKQPVEALGHHHLTWHADRPETPQGSLQSQLAVPRRSMVATHLSRQLQGLQHPFCPSWPWPGAPAGRAVCVWRPLPPLFCA